MAQRETYDLQELTNDLTKKFPQIAALYLFGSRRYRTGSPRSDVDVSVELAQGSYVRSQEFRSFSAAECPALDLFIADGGKAVSCANESHVQAGSLGELAARLEAVRFWSRTDGFLPVDIDWNFWVPTAVEFVPSAMATEEPLSSAWRRSLRSHFRDVEAAELPVKPYLGSTSHEVADFVVEVLRRSVTTAGQLGPKGRGWHVEIKNEYDFQNLFFLAFKPWLPGLGREEVTIVYDGPKKTADFDLFDNQIIVEMKHIRDANTNLRFSKHSLG